MNKDINHQGVSRTFLLNLLFVIVLSIFLITTIFSYIQSNKVKKTYEWVKHSHLVMQTINNIFTDLMVAESTKRGYLITGEPFFIFNLDEKINKIYADVNYVEYLTRDNPDQINLLIKLKALLQKRIEVIKNAIKLKETNQFSPAAALQTIYDGDELNNDIKTTIDEIYNNEEKLFQKREETFLNEFQFSNILFDIINILDIGFLIFIIVFFNKMLGNLMRAQAKTQKTESILKGIISGSNEYIAALDLDFNFLAFNEAFDAEFRKNFGKRPIIGESMKEALATIPEQQKKGIELWARALKGEEYTVIEEFGPVNALKKYEITFNPIYNEQNQLIGAAHIVRNIGQRVKEESKLKKFNEDLEASYRKVELQAEELTLLNEMNNVFRTSKTLEETLGIAVVYLKKMLPACSGVIYLMNHSRNYLEAMSEWNDVKISERIFAPEQCWALRQGKIYTYMDKNETIVCKHCEEISDLPPYICIPLLALNEIVGILQLQITQIEGIDQIQKFLAQKNILLQNLAGQIALAISNVKLQEFLKVRSTRDVLTNLYNRSYLNETFDRDLQRALRNNTSIAVLMMDLDHFKMVNDHYGHDAGDIVLKEVAKILNMHLRKSDVACRYGGEEILIILYDATREYAIEKAEFLRKTIAELEFRFVDLLNITTSFGIAMFPEDGHEGEDLIAAADAALYQSKMNGRNRVTVYRKNKSNTNESDASKSDS